MRNTVFLIGIAIGLGVSAGAWAAAATIPVGTAITAQNWQQYRQFVPPGLKGVFQSSNVTVGLSPGTELTVGPVTHYGVGHWFWDATEKYSTPVKLVKAPTGSYSIKSYVAGMPFPDIDQNDPLAGYKLIYGIYFEYNPAVAVNDRFQVIDTDRYGNVSFLHAFGVTLRWSSIVDPGYAMSVPGCCTPIWLRWTPNRSNT